MSRAPGFINLITFGCVKLANKFKPGDHVTFDSETIKRFPKAIRDEVKNYGEGPLTVLSIFRVSRSFYELTFYRIINGTKMVFSEKEGQWHITNPRTLLSIETNGDKNMSDPNRCSHGPMRFPVRWFRKYDDIFPGGN